MSSFCTTAPPFFCLSEWVRIEQDSPTPGRQNLGYQPPPHPTPCTPIPFGILAKSWNAKKKTKMLSKPSFLQN